MRAGATALAERGVDVAVWACTSGSFVLGWDGARRQAAGLSSHLGAPASSTSIAFVEALRALAATRVCIAATYPAPVTACFSSLLRDAGMHVVRAASQGILTGAEVAELDEDALVTLVKNGDHELAQVVVVPDTALHTTRALPLLERNTGKPVLTANQVSVWEALRLAGHAPPARVGFGALFE